MGFDQINGFRAVAGLDIGALDGAGLTGWKRRIDGRSLAVRAAAHAANDRVDAVAIALGIRQAAQGDDADAFAEHRAVCVRREGAAVPCGRKGRCFRETHIHENVVERVGAARENGV